ncbi:hypothetical protein ACQPZF_26455 [Actinosynnema sp. CS-041913]|uniref:hypothetical protein n=1 Tax=Actinosynnema sp. CS-041913 TaxID=3239917 RepID=UPI003D920722
MLFSVACAHFRTESIAAGVAVVAAIGIWPSPGRRPSAVRRDDVAPVGGFGSKSQGDVDLARRISFATREFNLPADPAAVQTDLLHPHRRGPSLCRE